MWLVLLGPARTAKDSRTCARREQSCIIYASCKKLAASSNDALIRSYSHMIIFLIYINTNNNNKWIWNQLVIALGTFPYDEAIAKSKQAQYCTRLWAKQNDGSPMSHNWWVTITSVAGLFQSNLALILFGHSGVARVVVWRGAVWQQHSYFRSYSELLPLPMRAHLSLHSRYISCSCCHNRSQTFSNFTSTYPASASALLLSG